MSIVSRVGRPVWKGGYCYNYPNLYIDRTGQVILVEKESGQSMEEREESIVVELLSSYR